MVDQRVGAFPPPNAHLSVDSADPKRSARGRLAMALRSPRPAMAAGLAAPALALTIAGIPMTVATACAGITYLVVRSTGPDLTQRRIPRAACWQAGFVGLVAAAAATFLGPSLSAIQLLGTLPILLTLHGGLTAAWWVTATSILIGLAAAFITAATTAIVTRRRSIPAGPALSALFVASAVVSLVAPSL